MVKKLPNPLASTSGKDASLAEPIDAFRSALTLEAASFSMIAQVDKRSTCLFRKYNAQSIKEGVAKFRHTDRAGY